MKIRTETMYQTHVGDHAWEIEKVSTRKRLKKYEMYRISMFINGEYMMSSGYPTYEDALEWLHHELLIFAA
jgi:hypothetical protein